MIITLYGLTLQRYKGDLSLCPVTALEIYMAVTKSVGVPFAGSYLFRPLRPSGEVAMVPLNSAAAQSRLSIYVQQLAEVFWQP